MSTGDWAMLLVGAFMLYVGLAIAPVFSSPALGHTLCGDDSEPTVVEFQESGASFGPYTAWKRQTIPCTETAQDAVAVGDDNSAYRWFRYISGPQGCIFTGNKSNTHIANIGGGRECHSSLDGGNCGFFGRGYEVFGVSGTSCSGFGVSLCGGLCR